MGLFGSVLGAVTSVIGGNAQKKAANRAADAQVQAANAAIGEQRRQFDQTQQNFAPYLNAGTSALGNINALLGISTPVTSSTNWGSYVQSNPDIAQEWGRVQNDGRFATADDFGQWHYNQYGQGEGRDISPFTQTTGGAVDQRGAIDALKASPLYTSLYRNGEEAVLNNASATGGLRGGNTQGALYNLGADTLSGVIQNQLSNLGGIANMGMGSAGQLGQFGANAANSIGSGLTQQGQARAGSALSRGGITAGQWKAVGDAGNDILSAIFPSGIGGLSI